MAIVCIFDRREVSELLTVLWQKWPNGSKIPNRLSAALSLHLRDLTAGHELLSRKLQSPRMLEGLVLVLGRLLEGAGNLVGAAPEYEEEEDHCSQRSARLLGFSHEMDHAGLTTSPSGRKDPLCDLELFYCCVSLVTLGVAPVSATCPALLVQVTELWVHAAGALEPIFGNIFCSNHFFVSLTRFVFVSRLDCL